MLKSEFKPISEEGWKMKKDSIPFGGAMKMKVAFCNGIGIDTSQMKRLIWISGQISFDEKENFIGKGNMRAQTEQVLKNIKGVLEKLGGTMEDIVQVTVFVKEMGSLKDIHGKRGQACNFGISTGQNYKASNPINLESWTSLAVARKGRMVSSARCAP